MPSDNYLNVLNSVLQFDLTTTVAGGVNATTTAIAQSGSNELVGTAFPLNLQGSYFILNNSNGKPEVYSVVNVNTATSIIVDRGFETNVPTGTYVFYKPARLQQAGAHNLIKRVRILYGSLVLEDIQEYKTLVRMLFEAGVSKGYFANSGNITDGTYGGRSGDPAGLDQSNYFSADWQATQSIQGTSGKRTFCLNLMTGLMTCKKLIPLKWMAAQLAIEITLASDKEAYISSALSPTMQLTNVNYLAEMVEFDSTYDSAFFQGLVGGGVPLKFSSWHFHSFNVSGSSQIFQIHERARSVKMALCVVKNSSQPSYTTDSEWFYHDLSKDHSTGTVTAGTGSYISTYQFRVGGRYYPSQPVRAQFGGAEAFIELQKCIDTLGDYRSDCNIDAVEWAADIAGGIGNKFIMAGSFENTDVLGDIISGINAEEQSDIALTMISAGNPQGSKVLQAFIAYDSLIIVRDGNVVDLVL